LNLKVRSGLLLGRSLGPWELTRLGVAFVLAACVGGVHTVSQCEAEAAAGPVPRARALPEPEIAHSSSHLRERILRLLVPRLLGTGSPDRDSG
jgi:hypothetical protein